MLALTQFVVDFNLDFDAHGDRALSLDKERHQDGILIQ